MNNSEKQKSNKRRSTLISIYLILAFGAYFLLFVLSRVERVKSLLGL